MAKTETEFVAQLRSLSANPAEFKKRKKTALKEVESEKQKKIDNQFCDISVKLKGTNIQLDVNGNMENEHVYLLLQSACEIYAKKFL